MNKVMLLGNIGADPELKLTQGGQAVLKFSLATEEKWKNSDGEPQKRTDWHRCNLWGKRAESLAKYLTKGSRIFVEGQIQYGSYEKEGVKHYTTDIKVSNVEFAGGGVKSTNDSVPDPDPHNGAEAAGDGDIPF